MQSIIWPFRTKVGTAEGAPGDTTTQWRRIDEGQDLQTVVGADVLAILAGTVSYAHNPSTDGGGFGATYPVVTLDEPYGPYHGFYLGHTYVFAAAGSHVAQGDVVSHTGDPGNGGTYPGWLECGWWGPSGPVGKGTGWTQAGQDMHDALVNAPVFGAQPPPEVIDVENLILVSPESGNGASYLWNTAHDTKRAIADQPTAQSFIAAGIKRCVMADGELASIPNA